VAAERMRLCMVVERSRLGVVVEMRFCVVAKRMRLCVVQRRAWFAAEVEVEHIGVKHSDVGGGP
jgi:hypothetical protein